MNKFKVGDIIVGKKYNGYRYTGEGSINEVTSIKGLLIFVKVIKVSPIYEGKGLRSRIGETYCVNPKGFELENPNLENV